MQDVVLSPSDFVALLNQTLEFAYPVVTIEGELSGFRISKNRWVYFDLQDEQATVKFFGTVYALPGPLQDGLKVRVVGAPRFHPRFGFSVNIQSITPTGEGSIKKAFQLLRAKLEREGLFAPERKRPLPPVPGRVGLVTAANSAAYHDFIKILNERWGGVEILLADVYVQGDQAPAQITGAIEILNKSSILPEVIVITRGGGGADDLAAFNDERVVRAVAASRAPTLVAVGHEVDLSLAELAADVRASTPSSAAQILVPDRTAELASLDVSCQSLKRNLATVYDRAVMELVDSRDTLTVQMTSRLNTTAERLHTLSRLVALLDPGAALRRGYAIIRKGGKNIRSVRQVKIGDRLSLQLQDGTIGANTTEVING
ncbi:MAG TPA: exodeoxyribonuclease VII large subunit [Candidatus Nitrosopolaris sp.]|nr:exodeoxyribonuclease VII large subunit [Candidatus Nitrosopolaris sp.]